MLELALTTRIGILPLDMEGAIEKEARALIGSGGQAREESKPGFGDYNAYKFSDPGNTLFWEHEHTGAKMLPRGGWGSWSFAVPALNEKSLWRALETQKTRDVEFKLLPAPAFHYGGEIPGNTAAAIVSTTGHGRHEPLAILSGGPLVADWLSDKAPNYSRHLYDMLDGDSVLNPLRHAGLHAALRVRKFSPLCAQTVVPGAATQYAIALNMTRARDGTGLGLAHFHDADAFLSHQAWGPLRAATITHELGFGDASLRSAAIDTKALYTGGNPQRDGPLPFEETDEPPVSDGVFPVRTFLWWRKNFRRKWQCAERDGRWDLHTKIPVQETPSCNPTKAGSVDSNGVPRRSFEVSNAVYAPGAFMAPRMIFLPRPGVLKGKPASMP